MRVSGPSVGIVGRDGEGAGEVQVKAAVLTRLFVVAEVVRGRDGG